MVYNTWDNIFGSGQYKTAKIDLFEKSHSEVWAPISTPKVNESEEVRVAIHKIE